jgi:hypothetical protein
MAMMAMPGSFASGPADQAEWVPSAAFRS